ncbi:polycystin-1-like protein 2 [Littorina saxatilis]|uniref:polycystin-1-like protein 2 n=1 Tax=Littorina saxatilis TaxID=31220 RepID=UPI0038B583D9
MIDKVVAATVPSYDLSIGANLLFNSSDVGEDDSIFMVSRLKLQDAVKDRRKMNTSHEAVPKLTKAMDAIMESREAVPKLTKAMDTMMEALLSGVVLGQPEKEVKRKDIAMAVGKMTSKTMANTTVTAGSLALKVDSANEDGSDPDPNAALDIKASVYDKNPFSWSGDGSSYEVTSPVVKVDMKDKDGAPKKIRMLTMSLKRGDKTPVPVMETYSSNDTREGPEGWLYHRMTLRSGSSAVVTRFQLPSDLSQVVAYFRTGRPPTSSRYDVRTEGEPLLSRRRRAADPSATVGATYHFFVPQGSLSPGIVFVGFQLPELETNDTRDYGFSSFSDACRVWNEDTETWDTSSCTVSADSSPEATVCTCSNPLGVAFASSFFVAPNTIDFSTVFSKFDITNASVYGTLMVLFFLWILALVWARRKDKQDRERWMVGYLTDNHVRDSHFYMMTVYTGMRSGAGTKSNVRFVFTGKNGQSRVRLLSDGERSLTTSSVLSYIVTTDKELGALRCIRLWHDDSGQQDDASWYLSRVAVEDLKNGEIYNFICEHWFALDKEDGLIDRVVPAVFRDDALTFDKLFGERARLEITDSHLWLSCFIRPDRSTFTRMQRVSCCFALLLLTMITSALFYQPEDNETGASTNNLGTELRIGPLRFSLTTLWTSFVSIIITTIPMFIFVVLFRSYRPRPGPRVTVHTASTEETRIRKIFKKLSKQEEDKLKEHDIEKGQLPETLAHAEKAQESLQSDEDQFTDLGSKTKDRDPEAPETPAATTQNDNETDTVKDKAEEDTKANAEQENLGKENAEDGMKANAEKENLAREMSEDGAKFKAGQDNLGMEMSEDDTKDKSEQENLRREMSEDDTKAQTKQENLGREIMSEDDAKAKAEQENLGKEMARSLSDLLQNTLQQNPLPHFWVYINWVLLVLTVLLCAFFMILYSMQWGSTTSEEWLAAFFLSFFESFFLMEPIKVLIVACLLAYCASNPFTSTQYQHVDMHRVEKEVQAYGTDTVDENIKPPKPVPEEILEASRKRRKQEKVAEGVFMKLILYLLFVFCIFSISYGNRDQRSFWTNKHLEDMLYSADGHAPFPFESISKREDVYTYMKDTLKVSAFPWTDILGEELHWRQRLYASDRVSFRVGPVRVRQVRMPQEESLKVTRWYPHLKSSERIYLPYSYEKEERGNYCLGWEPGTCPDDVMISKYSVKAWNYTTDVLPVSIWGTHAFYGSGGYLSDLTVNQDVVTKTIQELEDGKWLDLQTRGVFVELCLYNPNTNLFTFMRMGAEFPTQGATTIWRDLKTLALYQHQGPTGAFIFICELLVLIFVIVFTVRTVLRIKSQKKAFFKDFWQLLDLMALVWAYIALAFYITKILSVAETMEKWRYDPKVYVDFYLPVLWDALYGYILAALVFVVTIRLLRVLGYNKRVTMLATVLARSGHALLGYSIMFFIVISAYVTAGHVLFGATNRQFRSLWETYATLYVVLLGRPQIGKWISTAPLWAQIYHISLTFFVLFILYSMFELIPKTYRYDMFGLKTRSES